MYFGSPEGAAVDTAVNPRVLLIREVGFEQLSDYQLLKEDVQLNACKTAGSQTFCQIDVMT